jgi:hypothetical protein
VAAAADILKMTKEETRVAIAEAIKVAAMEKAVRKEENVTAREERVAMKKVVRREGNITAREDKKRAAMVEEIKEAMDSKVGATKEEATGKVEVKVVEDMKKMATEVGTRAVDMHKTKVDMVVETREVDMDKTKVATEVVISPEAMVEAVKNKATAAEGVAMTTTQAMLFVMLSSPEATAMKRLACSVKPCPSSAITSRTSRMKMLTSNQWCRLIRRCTARAAEISSMTPTLLVQAQPCRH